MTDEPMSDGQKSGRELRAAERKYRAMHREQRAAERRQKAVEREMRAQGIARLGEGSGAPTVSDPPGPTEATPEDPLAFIELPAATESEAPEPEVEKATEPQPLVLPGDPEAPDTPGSGGPEEPAPAPKPFLDVRRGEIRRDIAQPDPSWSRRGAILGVVIAAAVLLVIYAFTLAPRHFSNAVAAPATAGETVAIGDGLVMVPPEGWSVQPTAPGFVPGTLSWAVLAADSGKLITSPDGKLRIEVTAEPGGDPSRLLDRAPADAAEVHTETLASGLDLRHRDAPAEIIAVVAAGEPVFVRAWLPEGGDIDPYRPALSALLESIGATS